MKCNLCPRVAWYTVSGKGYCGQHKAEADAAQAKEPNPKEAA